MNFKLSIPDLDARSPIPGDRINRKERKEGESRDGGKELWQKNGGINMGKGSSRLPRMVATEITSSKSESVIFLPPYFCRHQEIF
jgi:hypothetical protein